MNARLLTAAVLLTALTVGVYAAPSLPKAKAHAVPSAPRPHSIMPNMTRIPKGSFPNMTHILKCKVIPCGITHTYFSRLMFVQHPASAHVATRQPATH